jgi:RNA polymerase sigma factor (TIGR02999 family)
MATDPQLVTRLLHEWRSGNREALDELTPLVYDQLRRLAARCLYSERPDHTLRATALVHEAYMRMMNANVEWQDRAHFYAVAARMLRRILVEYARTSNRPKRGGKAIKVQLDDAIIVSPEAADIVVELDEALDRLATLDQRKGEIVQLLYFGGMTYEETADALGISPATVHREMRLAKAWLYRELVQEPV